MEGPAGYSYNPEGRRDPFVSLVGRGNDPKQGGDRAAGIPGLLVNEVTVKGVIRGRSGYIAMIQSPDNKTYIVRSGDRLADGTVKTITQDGVVFSQDVNDPLSLVKHREVPKKVRGSEGRG
jgi:Tfp pilus assembly protein PilP